MHGILQGTAPVVLYHTLAIVSQEGLPVWSMLERYTKEWVLPAAWKCGHVHQLFDKKKIEKYKNSQRFACQASECLTLFPLVRHFLHTLVAKHGQCLEACEAFFATATVIDIIHQGCHHGLATPAALLQAIEKATQTFVHLDVAPLIKKWHWLLHLPDTLSRFQTLPSCFTCERKHKVTSRFATPMVATKSFDQALLGQVLCQEICTLQEPDLFQAGAHLVDCHKVSKKTLAFLTTFLQEKVENVESSLVLKTKKGGPCHKNDVVAFANDTNPEGIVPFQVGEVQLHLKINGVACALLKVWTIVEYIPSQQHATCSVVDDNLGFVPSDQIVCPLAYTKQEAEAKCCFHTNFTIEHAAKKDCSNCSFSKLCNQHLAFQLLSAIQSFATHILLFSCYQLFKALQPTSCFSVVVSYSKLCNQHLALRKRNFRKSAIVWL